MRDFYFIVSGISNGAFYSMGLYAHSFESARNKCKIMMGDFGLTHGPQSVRMSQHG